MKDDICDSCRRETETRFHFCECKTFNDIRTKITNEILRTINGQLHSPIKAAQMPCFWAKEQRHKRPPKVWVDLLKWNPAHAAMGIIPSDFITKFLEKLRWKDDTNLEDIIAEIQISIVKGHHQAWVERCKAFTAANKNPEIPDRKIERLALRQERRKEKETRRKQRRHNGTLQPSQDHPDSQGKKKAKKDKAEHRSS